MDSKKTDSRRVIQVDNLELFSEAISQPHLSRREKKKLRRPNKNMKSTQKTVKTEKSNKRQRKLEEKEAEERLFGGEIICLEQEDEQQSSIQDEHLESYMDDSYDREKWVNLHRDLYSFITTARSPNDVTLPGSKGDYKIPKEKLLNITVKSID